MMFYWQVYMENVDPIIKVLHVPAMTKIMKDLRADMSTLTPGVEALLFAIYFAAITSMEADEVCETRKTVPYLKCSNWSIRLRRISAPKNLNSLRDTGLPLNRP